VTLLLSERPRVLLALAALNCMALKVEVLTESPKTVFICMFWVSAVRGFKLFLRPEMTIEPAQLDPPQMLMAIC
jgi:hypothetical protein